MAIALGVVVLLLSGISIGAGPVWLFPAMLVGFFLLLVLDGAYAQWREAAGRYAPPVGASQLTLEDVSDLLEKRVSVVLEQVEAARSRGRSYQSLQFQLGNYAIVGLGVESGDGTARFTEHTVKASNLDIRQPVRVRFFADGKPLDGLTLGLVSEGMVEAVTGTDYSIPMEHSTVIRCELIDGSGAVLEKAEAILTAPFMMGGARP